MNTAATSVRPLRAEESAGVRDIIRAVMREYGLDGPGTGYDDPALENLYHTLRGAGLSLPDGHTGRQSGGRRRHRALGRGTPAGVNWAACTWPPRRAARVWPHASYSS